MGTYFGYVKREADSYINWADVGANIVKDIDAEIKIRSDKKAAYEKNQSETYNFVKNNPMGENTSANEGSLQLANDAQNYLLQLNKLVKSNKMSVSDYMIRSQNLKDDTTHMYGILKSFQERAKVISERTQKNENIPFELQSYAQLEGFGNFSTSYSYIDPATGHLWRAEKEKRIVDGKEIYTIPDKPTGKLQQMQSLAQTMQMNYNRFDSDATIKKIVGTLGKNTVEVVSKAAEVGQAGTLTSILDITQRKNLGPALESVVDKFTAAETAILKGQLTNGFNTVSILQTELTPPNGGQYEAAYSLEEAEADPSKIYMKVVNNKYVPDFESTESGRQQYQMALDHLRTKARLQYDYEEKSRETQKQDDVETERKYKLGMLGVAQENAKSDAAYKAGMLEVAKRNAVTGAAKTETEAKKQAKKEAEENPINRRKVDPAKLTAAVNAQLKDGTGWYNEDEPVTTEKALRQRIENLAKGLGFTLKGSGLTDDVITIKSPNLEVPVQKFALNDTEDFNAIIDYFKNPANYSVKNMPEALLVPAELND